MTMGRTIHHPAPSAAALTAFAALLAPGSRPANVRRLGGGVMMAMHTLDLVAPSGRRRLVVRRCPPGAPPVFVEFLRQGWRVLGLLERAGLPAPRPVYADFAGEIFDGLPTVVLTRVPGRGDLNPRDRDVWCRRLGAALAALHTTPRERLPGDVLPADDSFVDDLFAQMTPVDGRPTRFDAHPDGGAIVA